MRVLFINQVCGTGSTGKITASLAEQFEREGHTVKIAYGRSAKVPEKDQHFAVRIGGTFDVYVHALLTRLTDRHGLYSRRATKKFLRWAEAFNPDLLWLHNIHGYFINYEMLFEWIKSRPNMRVYWTLHDCWSFTGHCSYFTFAKCEKWREHCTKCPQKKAYPASFFDRSFKNFDQKRKSFTGVKNMTIITPSKWLASLVKQSFLRDYPVEVRYNEINREIFKPTNDDGSFRKKYHLENKFVILGVANIWVARKGIHDFIRLSTMLDPEKFAIVLIGVKPEQKQMLPNEVIAIERTENQQALAMVYASSDVFFNPTYEDNYPTVNLEAEACGTPVLTYDAGGSAETIHEACSKAISCGDLEAAKAFIVEEFERKYRNIEEHGNNA